jgi:hypothetical protein
MGFLNVFSGPQTLALSTPPSGSFTVNSEGYMVTSTIPQSFPAALLSQIGQQVLAAFRNAAQAQLQMDQLIVTYAGLKITAREVRGGAMVFLSPAPNLQE